MRILPISLIAEKWYQERTVGLPQKVIEVELQRAHVNLAPGRDWRAEGLVPVVEVYDLASIPSSETEVTKDWVEEFSIKQGWPLPRFWFPEEAPPVRPRGRPSNNKAILEELKARAERGELAGSVTDQARELRAWMLEKGMKAIQENSIRKVISSDYMTLKGFRQE